MSIRRYCAAALTGLTLLFVAQPHAALAQGISVLKKGTNAILDVPMNRAVVVEADVPFAELSIANPGIADISSLSDRTIYVLGKSPGMTTLTLLDASGRLITNVDVRVAADVSEFKKRLQQILPTEKIEVRTANDGIVLSGNVSSSQRLQRALDLAERYAPDRVSNLMTVGGVQQVMLKVRFAEMQRSVSKSLGSSVAFRSSRTTGETGTWLQGNNGLGQPTITPQGESLGAMFVGFDIGSVEFGILLEALEQKGLVRTLAEPNLSALSGQEASFLAGGEYPVPVAQDEGTTTVEFKPFGIELNFTPRVVDGDLINLELMAAVSAIDTANSLTLNGFSINAFTRRETATTVELRDGESFAIAGLIEDEFRDGAAQIPWLGDVPVLGALFRSADYERSQSELVIIVSAHLVTPTRGEALSLPTDRIRPPSEKNLFLFGRTERAQGGAAGEVANQDFNGSYGYLLD
ncbi:type II and III secretion system protein family protein [Tritonibacter scottomollicae]|uniref:Type II and III secretion system protein family protein n=1 Tax=Tritonibacter scottomollicae TaxID=483013 RepID=A0ABZ0HB40_TRISK|nr:type II and III secretion system protein family protein [Tritonibacter scottomollicae]WOI31537.1 type II and III secretion system protein family protein [Tritonibacter scottomollicae]